jgi:hypothetical protein
MDSLSLEALAVAVAAIPEIHSEVG